MNGIIHPCTHSDDGSVVRMTQEMMFLAIGNFVDKLSMASTIQHIPTCKPRGNSTGFSSTVSPTHNDADGKPVYRHTKSGTLFTYGDDGEPVKYRKVIEVTVR